VLRELGRFVLALWHVVGLIVLALLFVEFGVDWPRRLSRRLRYRRPTRPDRSANADAYQGARWAVRYFDEFHRSVRVDWRPYVEWWQRPAKGSYVTIDARGLRPTPGEDLADDRAVRIFCFGGSTMMGMGARDDATIPAVLARRLGELGHRAAVTNFGQLGHNSTQEAIGLCQLLKQGSRPDIALFYDGINEMAAAEQSGRADAVFNESRRRAEFNLLHPDRRRDLFVAALMTALPRSLRRLRRLTGLALQGPLPGADTDLSGIDLSWLAEAVVEAYAANLRLVRLLARQHGFDALFFWQPAITTKQKKSADETRFEADYTTDVTLRRRFYQMVIEAYRRHRQITPAGDMVDLSAIFDRIDNPVYIDAYHLSETGNALVAEAMIPAVAAAIGGGRQSTGG
jgi:lysophospholipase L1-like esterase